MWNPRRRKVSLYIFHLSMFYKVFQRFLTRIPRYALTQNKNIISAHQNTFASQEPTEDACYACLQATVNQNVNYHGQGWPSILSLKTPHTEDWMLAAAHYISHCGMADPAAPNHTLSYNPNILFAYCVQRDFPIV